jgi:LacI family transcriptional regulator
MATIYDVAKTAGVSITTVSHVLNGTRRVSKRTEQRVMEAVKVLNYRPSSVARALVRQETKTIALIVPDNVNPFFAELARTIESYGFVAGYSVVLCNSDNNLEREKAYLEMLISKRVDGVIVMTGVRGEAHLQSLRDEKLAAVVFDSEHELLDSVLLDNYGGGVLAVKHLLSLGHKRIACIRGPSHTEEWGSGKRVRAYRDTLLAAGLPVEPALLQQGDWTYQSGKVATECLLKLDDPPTAIVACNDNMAIGALAAVHGHGLAVPDDISIIGFDGITLSAYTMPPLTTIATSLVELGQQLCQLLLNRIYDQLEDGPLRITIGNQLLVRSSTASPRASASSVSS